MITAKAFAGKHYAVLGLARSGLATVEALIASGARVTAWDDDEEAREKTVDAVMDLSHSLDEVSLEFRNLNDIDLRQFASLVLSPGVPLNRSPLAARARDVGLEIIGDIELFARARAELPPHKIVGITGTNGKSTTTALIHHILQTAGMPSLMGGNIGLPILSVEPLPEGGVYVLELSSYQLDLTQSLDCDVAVLLNITPDHLDRYASFEAYAASKARLFEMQRNTQTAIFNAADDVVAKIADASDRSERPHAAQYLLWADGRGLSATDAPNLQGPHNSLNAVCAAEACRILEVSNEVICEALRTYPGLPHRMERVAERNSILFVNDSKATNATATAPALAAFPAIRWILGGQAKADNLDDCAPYFSHVRSAYTIGEAGGLFARLLGLHMPVAECGTLDVAVRAAAYDAREGDTVLLSPACASFDQFRDFEARGDAFRALVRAL